MKTYYLVLLCLCALPQSNCSADGSGSMCRYGKQVYHAGDAFPAADGCNTCSCMPSGEVACTGLACLSDGGRPPGGDAGTGGDGGDVVMCWGAGSPIFPTFDKSCANVSDCVFGVHQINCCGASRAIGMNKAEKARFDVDEKQCEAMYPPCGCPAAPTVAEDGQTPGAGQMIVVECQMSRCMTVVR